MLGIGCAASIAGKQDLVATFQSPDALPGDFLDELYVRGSISQIGQY
jgi:hypothetical protein